jgi:hypothetical protein
LATIEAQGQTCDLKDVEVLDAKGNEVDKEKLAKLLKEETVVMVCWGQSPDPLHLRVLKDGILILVLPDPDEGGNGGSVGVPGERGAGGPGGGLGGAHRGGPGGG